MPDAPLHVRARVRHEPDRSYAILVEGPRGEVLVGTTRATGDVLTMAREGAARLFGVPVEQIRQDVDVVVPRPPYGRDGQWVRIVSAGDCTDPEDLVDVGAAGRAYWFGGESSWFVTVAGSGTGIHPGEYLDFEPVVTDEEDAELQRYLDESAGPPA